MANNNRNNKRNNNNKRYTGNNVSPLSGPLQMSGYALRLIKNMAYGEFNMERDGHLFQTYEFLSVAINVAKNKLYENQVYMQALGFSYGNTNDSVIIKMKNKHRRAVDAWNYVYNTLGCMITTKDMGLLAGMMNRLSDYKYDL